VTREGWPPQAMKTRSSLRASRLSQNQLGLNLRRVQKVEVECDLKTMAGVSAVAMVMAMVVASAIAIV